MTESEFQFWCGFVTGIYVCFIVSLFIGGYIVRRIDAKEK